MMLILRDHSVYTCLSLCAPAHEGPLDDLVSHVAGNTCTLRVTDDEREALFVTRAGMARPDEAATKSRSED